MTPGTSVDKITPQWSEKGQGMIWHDDTRGIQDSGRPTRSIRKGKDLSGLNHEKDQPVRYKKRHTSTTWQASKRRDRAAVAQGIRGIRT